MQLMFWFAQYKNGDRVREKEIEFHDIKRDELLYFGLEGLDSIFTHHVTTGQFELSNNKIAVLLNDKLIGKSNDIINFKEKIEMFMGGGGGIVGYYTGWKEVTEDFSYVEVLFWVDMRDQKLRVRLRLTPLKEVCTFTMIINGHINERQLTFENIGRKKEFVFEI